MRRAPTAALAILLQAALLQGCSNCDRTPGAALTDCQQGLIVQGAVKTDILFVVDDSGSMSEEITNLRNNLVTFITALSSSAVANDFRIGVTTTSVETPAGTATGPEGCFVGPWLDGGSATLLADFQAQVGLVTTSGSGKEEPFRAMEQALTSSLLPAGCTNNAGFLRPGARLAVVFLSDEDDCSDAETPRAVTGTGTATQIRDLVNVKCHNESGDGVDYKFTRMTSIDHYQAFLEGLIDGEVRDVVLGAIVGVDAQTLAPTCGDAANSWCCGGTAATTGTCTVGQRATFAQTLPSATPPNVTSSTLCCGGSTAGVCGSGAGTACTSPCATAFDKADRFVSLLARFPGKSVAGSVCDASFATALEQIAGLIISPTVPLDGAPADPALLVVRVSRPDGTMIPCTVAVAGSAGAATADAVYAPPSGFRSATLTFGDAGACRLDAGYGIQIDVICAG